ncbi:putative DREV methyltransferase [Leptomonas pyrrhocoris]|uniref:Protein N-terminal glutamine amidohydrolase n=1 Tax=Leptomonas pyrrhocoris TaxID=157538 RepID=A0A0M9G8F9_LEPPY|nr:putative DREV methyltransferase [Leptomonas pyrrhocoris]KPA84920.1 putative DREV methyltransferase [Leptomonas pyrrhocoris]|eukprot:XP_015663359.1 putative DREV methyltransferase [Leptomonas pyrrhocoris]
MEVLLPYAHCYCEENAYMCLEKAREFPDVFDRSYAVFMSSFTCDPSREIYNQWTSTVPYRSFKSPDPSRDLVIWDYHVFTVVHNKANGKWFVIDHDSSLSSSSEPALGNWSKYCIDFDMYCSNTLFLEESLASPYKSRVQLLMDAVQFRVIDGDEYLLFFRSDRSHMIDNSDKYSQKPPSWPPISDFPLWADSTLREKTQALLDSLGPSFQRNNITSLVNMANSTVPGTVVKRHLFSSLFSLDIAS